MVETDDLKVVWIGAGNLATRLSLAMKGQGMNIVQLFSRTSESAQELSLRLDGVPYVTSVEEIRADADLYIFAVKDTVLPDLIRHVAPNNGLWVHTAGSIPMSVFEGRVPRFGVFYPMQTFSKEREVDFREIPFLIEAARPDDAALLRRIAARLSDNVYEADSVQRKYLHLSAVFAGNFSNHMYAIAARLLQEHGLPFEVLLPLIRETAAKVERMSPVSAQTGPAVRFDRNVMAEQSSMLSDRSIREIYDLLSRSIYRFSEQKDV